MQGGLRGTSPSGLVTPSTRWLALCFAACLAGPTPAWGQASGETSGQPSERVLEIAYTPTAQAQVAIWVEDADGAFVATLALTEAVAYRGIGNRPGASQMNSGYRYPWGRREGVLPIWAHRRAAADGARLFPRVVFQDRDEGAAGRSVDDYSPDTHFCLQFDQDKATRDALDAMSCATVFNSDKGRYMTEEDAAGGYAEPWQFGSEPGGTMLPLPLASLYPPRMDVTRCLGELCFDHADVDRFADDARAVMPEIDAVTRATAAGGVAQRLLFRVPESWPDGDYRLWLEINVEGDYNAHWNDTTLPTPSAPMGAWDDFALLWGYPYRGQPSIAFSVPFTLAGAEAASFAATAPSGRSSWQHWGEDYGALLPVETGDAAEALSEADGSGVDRLQRDPDGARVRVRVMASAPLSEGAVGPVQGLSATPHEDTRRSHEWVRLRFLAVASERPLHRYEVRVASQPIVDEESFIRLGRPARTATTDPEGAAELVIPTDAPPGQAVEALIGDLTPSTHHYIGVRAQDDRGNLGPLAVTEVETTERTFTTVTACFVATAAYGTPMAHEVSTLRRFRDRFLLSHGPGRTLVAAYYRLGPPAARVLERHPRLRALVRVPLGWLVEWMD